MTGFILRALIAALGLWLATDWVTGVNIDTPTTLVLAGLLLGVVNAAMLALVAWLLPGFHLSGFRAAFLASIIVSITGWIGSWLIGSRGRVDLIVRRGP